MSLSIITPHYNDLEGLKRIYSCLQKQTNADWEWMIVDDVSDITIIKEVENWFTELNDKQVRLICNQTKTNASVCRNIGADVATFDHLVFLDADDYVTSDFVANRQVVVTDFVVFKNMAIDDKHDGVRILPKRTGNYLNHFLKTQFIWQTSSILWERHFFNAIGKFNSKLPRLQDVELSIRAMQKSTSYKVLDNPVDFYYRVKPIRERQNFVQPVCDSVYLFISELLDTSALKEQQVALISSYYYLCVKYLVRSGSVGKVPLAKRNLNLFYKKRYITRIDFLLGTVTLKLYLWKIISNKLFLKVNRHLFKRK